MNRSLDYIINLVDGSFKRGMNQAEAQTNSLDKKFVNLAKSVGAAFAVKTLYDYGKESVLLSAKLEAMDIRMKAASRTTERFETNSKFLRDTISSLKLPLAETTEGYSKFLGGVRGTSIEGDKANAIFRNMSIGIKALKLGPEEASRVFNALGKMVSTGTVQADEFKGQLAEAMPGAVEMGAKAMGMSMQQFYKQMEKGNIRSAEFVQLFSEQLVKEYGGTIPTALQSMQSRMAEVDNAMLNTSRTLGDALEPVVSDTMAAVVSLADATTRLIAGQTPLADKLRSTQFQLNAEFEVLKKGNLSYTQRKELIDSINTQAGPYLKNLLTEKSTIEDITAAQKEMNGELNKKIAIQAKSEIEADLIKEAVNLQKSSMQFRVDAEAIKAGARGGTAEWRKSESARYMATAKEQDRLATAAQNELRNIDTILNNTLAGMGITMDESLKAATNNNREGIHNVLKAGKAEISGTNANGSALVNGNTTSVAAGRSVRNINVDIKNLVGEFNINTTNMKEGAQDAKRIVQDALVRSVMDAEAAL